MSKQDQDFAPNFKEGYLSGILDKNPKPDNFFPLSLPPEKGCRRVFFDLPVMRKKMKEIDDSLEVFFNGFFDFYGEDDKNLFRDEWYIFKKEFYVDEYLDYVNV